MSGALQSGSLGVFSTEINASMKFHGTQHAGDIAKENPAPIGAKL
jgi:hypothetical protein